MAGLLSGIGSALSSGAVDAANSVGNSSGGGGWWNGVTDFATDAFNWIGDNPEAANMIGGVAAGAATGYMQNQQAKEQRVFEEEMYDRRRRDRQIEPGDINNYGTHRNAIAGNGAMTAGDITGGA